MIGTACFPEPPHPHWDILLREVPKGESRDFNSVWCCQSTAILLSFTLASLRWPSSEKTDEPACSYLPFRDAGDKCASIQKPLEGILCAILDNVLCDTHLSHSSPVIGRRLCAAVGVEDSQRTSLKSLLSFLWGHKHSLVSFKQAIPYHALFIFISKNVQ